MPCWSSLYVCRMVSHTREGYCLSSLTPARVSKMSSGLQKEQHGKQAVATGWCRTCMAGPSPRCSVHGIQSARCNESYTNTRKGRRGTGHIPLQPVPGLILVCGWHEGGTASTPHVLFAARPKGGDCCLHKNTACLFLSGGVPRMQSSERNPGNA